MANSDIVVAIMIMAFAYLMANKGEPTEKVIQPFAGVDSYATGLVENTPWAPSRMALK